MTRQPRGRTPMLRKPRRQTPADATGLAAHRATPAVLIAGGATGLLTQLALAGFSLQGPYLAIPIGGAIIAGASYYVLVYGRPRRLSRKPRVGSPWVVPPAANAIERPPLMNALLKLLISKDTPVVAVTTAVVGAGGFGKTTLASQLCGLDEIRSRFTGGLLWATIGQERTGSELAATLNDLSEAIEEGRRRPQFSNPEQAGRYLAGLLDDRPATLIVVDDVWTREQLDPFLFSAVHATLLVTTRMPASLPTDARMVKVDEMSRDESRRLICREVAGVPEESVDQLLELSGNWALLLAMINGALRRSLRDGAEPGAAARDLIEQLRSGTPTTVNPRLQHSRNEAIKQTIGASVRLLGDRAPEQYFELGIFAEDSEIPLAVLSVLWDRSATETRALCEDLADLSLVRAYQRGSATLQLHDVIRDHLRSELGQRLPAVNSKLLDAARALLPSPAAEWWQLPRTQDYLWRQLAYHMQAAGWTEDLTRLVLDLRWGEEKIRRLGLPSYESDLERVTDPVVDVLRRALARKGHLLGPIEPQHAHADVLVSRLGEVPELRAITEEYVSSLSTNVARLTNKWPIPPVDPALLRVVAGHVDTVTGCVISPNGRWLATTGADATVRIWSTVTWAEIAVLAGHTGSVLSCTVAPSGGWLATTAEDATVRVWSTDRWTELKVLRGHSAAVVCSAVARDGSWLATADTDSRLRLWSTSNWTELKRVRLHTGGISSLSVARDGSWLVIGGDDGAVHILETARWTETRVLRGHSGPVVRSVIARDGSWLATAGTDASVRIWDARSWAQRTSLSGHVGAVTGCAVAPDGLWLATTGVDHTVRIWDTSTWTERSHLRGHTEAVTACAIARDGSWLATTSADHNIRVWDTSRWYERDASYAQNRSVTSCGIDPHSSWLVTAGTDKVVCVWSVDAPTVRATLLGHRDQVTDCVAEPHGRWVATASMDRTVRIWRTETWTESLSLAHPVAVTGCAVDPDGRILATTGVDGCIRLFATDTWRIAKTLADRRGPLGRAAFSPDGVWFAAVARQPVVQIWDSGTWRRRSVLNGHEGATLDCAFSPDAMWVATTSVDQTVRVWSTSSWSEEQVLTGHGAAVTACAFSPDGAWLATTGADSAVRIWDVSTWQLAAAMRTNGEPHDVVWLPDGRALCIGAVGGIYQFAFAPATG